MLDFLQKLLGQSDNEESNKDFLYNTLGAEVNPTSRPEMMSPEDWETHQKTKDDSTTLTIGKPSLLATPLNAAKSNSISRGFSDLFKAPEQYPNSPADPTPFNFSDMGMMNPPLNVNQDIQTPIVQQPEIPSALPKPTQNMVKPIVAQQAPQQSAPVIPSSPVPAEQNVPEQDILGQLQDQRRQGLANVGLLSAADQIGRAIAGQGYLPEKKLDVSHILSQYNAPVEDYMQKQKAELGKLDLEKAKAQAANQKMRDDPNSEISKLARYSAIDGLNRIKRFDLASKISPNMSSTLIEDSLGKVNLSNMITNYDTQQNRLAMTQLNQSNKNEARLEKLDAKKQDFITQRYDNLTKSKPYQFMAEMSQAKNLIDDAILDPSGVKDISALYAAIKAFDPNSAVKEGEIKLMGEARSAWGKLNSTFSKFGDEPRVLDKETLKQLQEVTNSIFKQSQQQYKIRVQPVLDQAKKRGIKEEDYSLIDPLYDSFKKMDAEDQNDHPQFNINDDLRNGIAAELKRRKKGT